MTKGDLIRLFLANNQAISMTDVVEVVEEYIETGETGDLTRYTEAIVAPIILATQHIQRRRLRAVVKTMLQAGYHKETLADLQKILNESQFIDGSTGEDWDG